MDDPYSGKEADGESFATTDRISPLASRSDATPAYRGYRRQALYTLWRILQPNEEDLTFQLESIEDLAVLCGDKLVEAVQVKSLGAAVTLSDLVSMRPEGSFFHRAASLAKSSSAATITVASFGPIGLELKSALDGDETTRAAIFRKLTEAHGISPEDVSAVLDVLRPQEVDEETLKEQVYEFLRQAVTGTDPEAAFDLLNHWLYECAERKCHITKQDVVERINNVGRFVSERGAFHAVWFSSVFPIENRSLAYAEQESLRAAFYRGVDTTYAHILAGVDVFRPEKMHQISAAFAERNVVILHAASGQGKSTLAYRYLHQELLDLSRYFVRIGKNPPGVIAAALEGQANALGIPIVVFIDAEPGDDGWPELVKRLGAHAQVRVIVAVREEDWRLARFVNTDIFRDVDLDFDRHEAEQIYDALGQTHEPPAFLDFEEAWTRFGERGPLLEFVYLITQGGLLRERLADQIAALKRQANCGARGVAELELLRLVSVVSAYGGRLRVRALADYLRLPDLGEAISLLEDEYLVRRTEGGSVIDGLHPVRSVILTELLTDRDINPWSASAVTVLTLLDERDIEKFLLHSFSRRRADIGPLIEKLVTFHPNGWIGIAGVLRALLWLGLREYADINSELIKDARRDSGPGWSVVLDTDIAGAMPNGSESLLEPLRTLAKGQRIARIEDFRARQTPKDSAYLRAKSWLQSRNDPPELPSSVEGWLAAAVSAFWIGRMKVGCPLSEWLPAEKTADATITLPLDAAADLVAGLAEGYGDGFLAWHSLVRLALAERFQHELLTPLLEDDGNRMVAHFLVTPDDSPDLGISIDVLTLDPKNPLHNEALIRIDLMRRLFPDRETYGCQGYGHGSVLLQLSVDDTRKTGIPRSRLPLHWQASINATFNGIVDFEMRPANWAEYAREVMTLREEVVRCLEDLRKALPTYLRSSRPLEVKIPSEDWYRTWILLRDPPHLPQSAVDEWGFVYEGLRDSVNEGRSIVRRTSLSQIPGVRRYKPILESVTAYARPLENFLSQAPTVLEANRRVSKSSSSKGKRQSSNTENSHWESGGDRRLPTHNLGQAWIALPEIQQQFRLQLGSFVESQRIETLESRETELFAEVWPLWFSYALQPDRVLAQPISEAVDLLERTIRTLNKALERELRRSAIPGVKVSVDPGESSWEADPVLWLTIDGEDGVSAYNAAEAVLNAVLRAISGVADNELRRHALDFRWRRIIVVPLLRGKSLSGMAWNVHTGLLVRAGSLEELGWVQLQMHPIPEEAKVQHGFGRWDDPRLAPGNDLAEAAVRLWPLVLHMADLSQLPEIQGAGEELAIRHVEEMMSRVNAATQSVIDAVAELSSAIGDVIGEKGGGSAESKVDAFEATKMLYSAVLPTKGFEKSAVLKVRDFGPWSERLREGLRYALIAQLAWASAVLVDTGQELESRVVVELDVTDRLPSQ